MPALSFQGRHGGGYPLILPLSSVLVCRFLDEVTLIKTDELL